MDRAAAALGKLDACVELSGDDNEMKAKVSIVRTRLRLQWKRVRQGWCLGDEAFRKELLFIHTTIIQSRPKKMPRLSRHSVLTGFLCCGLLAAANAQTNFQLLVSCDSSSGLSPEAPLIEGTDGKLYGTAGGGGSNGCGTVFKLNKNGSGYSALHHFIGDDGSNPRASLMQWSDGTLYGTTSAGGTNGEGTVFRLNTDGSGFTNLHHFTGSDGRLPLAGLVSGNNGELYGTTIFGGERDCGTIFKLSTNGSDYAVLHYFGPTEEAGLHPFGSLLAGNDGSLYGTTEAGAFPDAGVIFKLNTDGSNYTVLHVFGETNEDGESPEAGLLEGNDGKLYGTTRLGGSNNGGTVFRLNTDGNGYINLHSFTGDDGSEPYAGLVQGSNGALYGTTFRGGSNDMGTAFRLNTDGSGYTVLHHFADGSSDGSYPLAGLVRGSDGAFYGTTSGVWPWPNDSGTVFKLFSGSPQPVAITGIEFTATGVFLNVSGAPSQSYQIEARTDLNFTNDWQILGSNVVGTNGSSQFLDADATNYPARFYRSVTP
jgi:uncharacterized repeat protein (TIGR03803 family)